MKLPAFVLLLVCTLLTACSDNSSSQTNNITSDNKVTVLEAATIPSIKTRSRIENQPLLNSIKERGKLVVLSRPGLTTFYEQDNLYVGFEYELTKLFAKRLNVELEILPVESLGDVLRGLTKSYGDIAAASLTITDIRKQLVRFGPVYNEVTQQLVYKMGKPRPKSLADINNGLLEVISYSSHAELLDELQKEIPALTWIETKKYNNSQLLKKVASEEIDYTILDSNEISANQTLFPDLRVAFDISEPQPIAWALPRGRKSDSLYNEIIVFFQEMESSGELDKLIEKYYGVVRRFDYVDTRAFHRRLETHLPLYETLFKEAAEKYDFTWELLAAQSYQESHWNPDAVSSTGVRGLMMLTNATAKEMKVEDREDPAQSIEGGAAYLASMYKRIPQQIQPPDRLWFALAAYNIGLGHLEDGRVITQKRGKNPNSWKDVRDSLPLLKKQKWYSQTRYGYARGGEPVRYVDNIRRYMKILLNHGAMLQE